IMRARASPPKRTSFAAMVLFLVGMPGDAGPSGRLLPGDGGPFDDAHDVGLGHDQKILAVELDLAAGPLAEKDAVTGSDFYRHPLARLVAGARADGDDLAFHRLLLGGVGNDDTAG